MGQFNTVHASNRREFIVVSSTGNLLLSEALEPSRRVALVVDDTRTSRHCMAAQLQNLGWQTDLCADGLDAWRRFDPTLHRLIVTDYEMPRWDGLDLLRLIRRAERGQPPVPIICVTTSDDITVPAEVRSYREAYFLKKPINYDALCAVLEKAAQGCRAFAHEGASPNEAQGNLAG